MCRWNFPTLFQLIYIIRRALILVGTRSIPCTNMCPHSSFLDPRTLSSHKLGEIPILHGKQHDAIVSAKKFWDKTVGDLRWWGDASFRIIPLGDLGMTWRLEMGRKILIQSALLPRDGRKPGKKKMWGGFKLDLQSQAIVCVVHLSVTRKWQHRRS